MTNEEIRCLIDNRTETHHSIYADIGNALESVSTADLTRLFIEDIMRGNESFLRTYLEEKIIAAEIEKIRYSKV